MYLENRDNTDYNLKNWINFVEYWAHRTHFKSCVVSIFSTMYLISWKYLLHAYKDVNISKFQIQFWSNICFEKSSLKNQFLLAWSIFDSFWLFFQYFPWFYIFIFEFQSGKFQRSIFFRLFVIWYDWFNQSEIDCWAQFDSIID